MNQTGYAVPIEAMQGANALQPPHKSSDTEIARSSIEGQVMELSNQIAVLTDKLSTVLRPDQPGIATKDGQIPPRSTIVHGWLCDTRDQLALNIAALQSLNSRIEV